MSTSESGVDEPGAAQDAERARQAAYMKKVADKYLAERKDRRAELKKRETYDAITRATERLQSIAHPEQPYIVIRSDFLILNTGRPYPPPARQPENIASRPSLTRVQNGKNPHALPVYLNSLFVHQMRAAYKNGPGTTPRAVPAPQREERPAQQGHQLDRPGRARRRRRPHPQPAQGVQSRPRCTP